MKIRETYWILHDRPFALAEAAHYRKASSICRFIMVRQGHCYGKRLRATALLIQDIHLAAFKVIVGGNHTDCIFSNQFCHHRR